MSGIFCGREWFAAAAALFWAAAAVGIFSAFRSRGNGASGAVRAAGYFLTFAAWVLLSFALSRRGTESGTLPVSDIFEIFQTLGWFAMFSVVLLRAVWSLRVPAVFGAGAAALLCSIGFANAETWDAPRVPAETIAGTPWAGVHAAFATVAYACFTAAAMVWLIFLVQNSALRRRRTHRFFSKLPDLASLDRIAGRLCAAGLVIFGAGAAIGVAVLLCGGRLGSTLAIYKTSLAAAIFAGFFLVIFLRRKNKISAVKTARAGLAVFVAALILLGGTACIRAASERAAGTRTTTEAFSE